MTTSYTFSPLLEAAVVSDTGAPLRSLALHGCGRHPVIPSSRSARCLSAGRRRAGGAGNAGGGSRVTTATRAPGGTRERHGTVRPAARRNRGEERTPPGVGRRPPASRGL